MNRVVSDKEEIQRLKQEIAELKRNSAGVRYYASHHALEDDFRGNISIPVKGRDPRHVKRVIQDIHSLDFNERLNTSSYVNVAFEEEEAEVASLGLQINLADQTVYPASFKLHDTCVNMVANLWNCPQPDDFEQKKVHAGAQTVGSTEGCLLAGLCLKFRWRAWYQNRKGLSDNEILGVRPNLVISTCFQACWEKLFRYFDVEPRLVPTSVKHFMLEPEALRDVVDECTIGVVCILGNHYGGHYDDVAEISRVVGELNEERDLEVGLHVDAASGGFIAPFQEGMPAWDFRLPNVLSISGSGHKFGVSVCGTGWVIWRQRAGLSEYVAVTVAYLGGQGESYTLNFSRPASGVYVQFFKFLRLGMEGYAALENNTMDNARYLREELKAMTVADVPRFEILDADSKYSLPVVAARLNPALALPYNDIDLQHQLAEFHWYVSGYKMRMHHPITHESLPLFYDADANDTMFRIVVKSNLTRHLAIDLIECVKQSLQRLDEHYEQHPSGASRWAFLRELAHGHGHAC